MRNNTYCVIMAGGVGSRFWPLSKSSTPKQFLDILGTGKSLLRQTFERFIPICKPENFLIVTSSEYGSKVLEQLPEISPSQVLKEPFRRNTAPCIAYANSWIRSREKDANIIVSPADHLIIDEQNFLASIQRGLEFVENNQALLTLGIKPHRPETGYGYIQVGNGLKNEHPSFFKVKTFTEKPNAELARVFYESGEFFWNSGIFLWRLESIDKAFAESLPDIQSLFRKLDSEIGKPSETQALNDIYVDCQNISIDYGVMEKAQNVYVQTVSFGWSDLGTWSSLYDYSNLDKDKNALISGDVLLYETSGNIINVPPSKVAVIKGLKDYIVVDSGEALLICPKDSEQQIRQFTNDIKTEFGDKVL
jgi:mannose-1-phosphate guanylyltransferase